jgi:phenylacetate-CoA ligase
LNKADESDEKINYYWQSVDWSKFIEAFPPPPHYQRTVGRYSEAQIRALQNTRFLARVAEAWKIPFYRERWLAAGLQPEDIRSLDDIQAIPPFTTDDLKQAAAESPPYGNHHPISRSEFHLSPIKMQTSGGTTGMPRVTLFDASAWEVQGILAARALYSQGARPGDVIQIPYTQGLANAGWSGYTGIFHWLGAVPVTTGSGAVTPSERQLEYAKAFGVNGWFVASEYLDRLTEVARQSNFDLHQLPTRYLHTFLGADNNGVLRDKLEKSWNAPVFDSYGSHEVGSIAFECRHHQRTKHVCEDVAFVEIHGADTGVAVPYGEPGNVVVTSLHRSVPPFIRYNIRDLMILYDREPCGCGMTTKKLSMMLGRSDEMIKLRATNVYPLACQETIALDPRVTNRYICVAYWVRDGSARREEMAIRVERSSASVEASALAQDLVLQFHRILSVRVGVEIYEECALAELTRGAYEAKPRRLLDLRRDPEPYQAAGFVARAK